LAPFLFVCQSCPWQGWISHEGGCNQQQNGHQADIGRDTSYQQPAYNIGMTITNGWAIDLTWGNTLSRHDGSYDDHLRHRRSEYDQHTP